MTRHEEGRIGVMGAMPQEIALLTDALEEREAVDVRGMRQFERGVLWGSPAVVVSSRMGKVAAAATAAELIMEFGVDRIVFTGVAGGVDPDLAIGDVVIGRSHYQHDLDARPLFGRHEVPLLGRSGFPADPQLVRELERAAVRFVSEDLAAGGSDETKVNGRPRVVCADIASGDQFVHDAEQRGSIRETLPGVACVDMESGAVAQVCYEFGVPFGVVRTLSDSADEGAHIDFEAFVESVAARYSLGVLRRLLSG